MYVVYVPSQLYSYLLQEFVSLISSLGYFSQPFCTVTSTVSNSKLVGFLQALSNRLHEASHVINRVEEGVPGEGVISPFRDPADYLFQVPFETRARKLAEKDQFCSA